MKQSIKKAILSFRNSLFNQTVQKKQIRLITGNDASDAKTEEVIRRIKYFDGTLSVTPSVKADVADFINFKQIAYINGRDGEALFKLKKNQVFDFDYDTNPKEGWDYHYLLTDIYQDIHDKAVAKGKAKLKELKNTSPLKDFQKAYIFGTGGSLEKAIDVDWSDGLRIVSNTIVKDKELWTHINPHFIVAGDGIYHYGMGGFPENFRKDLKECMQLTDTYFVFPSIYYAYCLKEFSEFSDRLIPIPDGPDLVICKDLVDSYSLPSTGNVLLLLLLPLSCTFSKNIFLWGFDGRAPTDKMFWKNSSKHFYQENVEELTHLHPAFFNEYLPKDAPERYVKLAHGDNLELALSDAEKIGYKFNMMHFSYTEVLQKRFSGEKNK